MSTQELVFTSNRLPLENLLGVILNAEASDPSSTFSLVTLKCRQIIFEFAGQIAASPLVDSNSILMIGHPDLLRSDKFKGFLSKLKLSIYFSQQASSGQIVECLSYTLASRLAPAWNRVGEWLLSGRQFLQASNAIKAVQMKVHFANGRVEVVLKAALVKFPLLKPEDVGVSHEQVEAFLGSESRSALTEQNFGYQNVIVLPRLSRAKLVSVTKKLPEDSKFTSWSAMKRYWKNMYGYRLGDDDEEPVVYYNVSFFNNPPMTYPELTVRKFAPRPIPRTDPEPIVRAFIQDLLVTNRTVCGFAFSLTRPINISNNNFNFTSGTEKPMLKYGFHNQTVPYRNVDQSATYHQPSWTKNEAPASNNNHIAFDGVNEGANGVIDLETVIDCEGDKQIKDVNNENKDESDNGANNNIGVKNNEAKRDPLSKPKIKPTFLARMLSSRTTFAENKKTEQNSTIKPSFSRPKSNILQDVTNRSADISKRPINSLLDSNERSEAKLMKLVRPVTMSKPCFNPKTVTAPKLVTSLKPTASLNHPLPSSSKNTPIQPNSHRMLAPMKKSVPFSSREFKKPLGPTGIQASAPLSAVKKKPTIANVNIDELVHSRRLSEVSKLNVATLLDYCRNSGIKQAKAKSKKDELLRLIYLKHNVISANEQ